MKPQPGTQVTLVPPLPPAPVVEADDATPGEVEQLQVQTQEPKKAKFKPVKFESAADETVPSWIEIELLDEQGKGVPGVRYRVTVPDGSAAEGSLDAAGFARVEGFEKGDCKITFPDLDRDAWEEG